MNIKQSSKNQKYRKIFKQKIKKYLKLLKKSLKLIFIKNTNRKYKNFMYQNNKKYKKSAKIINFALFFIKFEFIIVTLLQFIKFIKLDFIP